MGKVAVAIVSYNQASEIGGAVRSVLSQTVNFSYEIVIADDASSDGTAEQAIREIMAIAPDMKISLLPSEINLGVTKNYQRLFDFIECEYLFIIEGDDHWINKNKMQKQFDFLETYQSCSVVFGLSMVSNKFENNYKISDFPPNYTKAGFPMFYSPIDLARGNFITGFSNCCYRTASIKSIDPKLFEMVAYDWAINISCGNWGPIGFIPEILSEYRVHPGGVWSQVDAFVKMKITVDAIENYRSVFKVEIAHELAITSRKIYQQMFVSKIKSREYICAFGLPGAFRNACLVLIKFLIPSFFKKIFVCMFPPIVVLIFKKNWRAI